MIPGTMTATATSHPVSQPSTNVRPRMIVAASIGNALEFYDFLIYAFFATSIAAAFFPGRDSTTGLMLTFGTFGISFLARPIGAMALGAYADRKGRVGSMTISIALMTLGTVTIALMPTSASIGVAAPIGILAARLMQGFALGGEFGSSTAFMIEHAAQRQTWAASWQSTSQFIAATFASGVAWLLTELLPPANFTGWGFRIALGLGAAIGPIALLLRRTMQEPTAFLIAVQNRPASGQDKQPCIIGGIALGAGLLALGTGITYLDVYLPTYAVVHLHLSARSALGTIFLTYLAMLSMTPLRLMIADRYDRRRSDRMMLISCVLLVFAGYPSFMLLDAWPSTFMLFLIPIVLAFLSIFYVTPLPVFMGMVFPIHRRGAGLSIGYALGVALFGGFAPLINTWLVSSTGDARSPGAYVTALALLTMIALLVARRRQAYSV